MLDAQEAIKKFLDFESRANAKRSAQIERIKADRSFLSGEQWSKEDDTLISKSRSRRTVNILANSVNAIANQYANYPYKWYSGNNDIDSVCNGFLKTGSNQRAGYDALYSSVAFGLGYFALGSEQVTDGETGERVEIPALYSIDKLENVYFDPDSISVSGDDAIEAAIVEMRSKNYVRAKYGIEWAPSNGTRAIVNVSDNHDSDVMCIVTYYLVEDGKCSVYRLLNNDFLEEPQQLDIGRVPVFPVYGERTWNGSELLHQGLVRKGSPIQRLINYAFTQLSERMAVAPKPVWLADPEAIEGYDEGYKNFNNNLNPLLLWNPTTPDKKKALTEPKRMDNQVQFADITGIIGSNLELLSSITGVDSRGILDGNSPQVTATEVIYNERQVHNATRHYFANLRDTFKAVGETVLSLLGYGNVSLEVIQGPGEYMEKQVARQELIALAGIVPEQDKMKMVDGILLSHNDNIILRNVFGSLHSSPTPTPMEQQAFDTIEQMKQALEEKNRQLEEMKMTINRYENGEQMQDKSLRADFAMQDLKHRQDMEKMAFQAQLEAGADANKAVVEQQEAQMELEKKAVELDAAKVKASAEMMKAAAGAPVVTVGGF